MRQTAIGFHEARGARAADADDDAFTNIGTVRAGHALRKEHFQKN